MKCSALLASLLVMLSSTCLLAADEPKKADPATPVKKPEPKKNSGPIADRITTVWVDVLPPQTGTSETIELFNGKNLDGWEGDESRWSVKDGAIVGMNAADSPQKVSTYLLTKRKFTDFRLVFDGKLARTETHTGIAFWGHQVPDHGDPHTFAGHLVMFPSGWGMYDLFGRNQLPVDNEPGKKAGTGKQHEWNHIEILAQGNRIQVAANGVEIVNWVEPEAKTVVESPIGLQLHSNKDGQEVQFKNLKLTTFPTDDKLTTLGEKK